MRIEKLYVKNFRGFTEREFTLHPQFNLVVGENGTGKTSVLEAFAVAVGSWFLGMRGQDSRHIRTEDMRYEASLENRRYRIYKQYPVLVRAVGVIEECYEITRGGKRKTEREDNILTWERTITGEGGRTTYIGAMEIKNLSTNFYNRILAKEKLVLPLIRYFGASRLWDLPRDIEDKTIVRKKGLQPGDFAESQEDNDSDFTSPFYGYRLSVDKRCNPNDLIRWMGAERLIELDEEGKSPALRLVYKAIDNFLSEVLINARYSVQEKTLMLRLKNGQTVAFQHLSDGYRNVVAMVADLAIKAVMLNPHLGTSALTETPGVVLIDELDLHLHPKWQRRIIEDLRRTFPKIQFICTTHSPFLIQSLRSGEELIMLDDKEPTNTLANLGIETIAEGIMGVENPDASPRYIAMLEAAKGYLAELDEAEKSPAERLEEYKRQLADRIAPYADNPAFQAILETERTFKLGE